MLKIDLMDVYFSKWKKSDFLVYSLFAILTALSMCGFYTIPIYYAYFCILLYIIVGKRWIGVKGDILLVLFIISAAIGLVMNTPPSIFRSWERLGAFILLLLCVSPLIYSRKLFEMRVKLFVCSLYVLTLLSVASFICYPLEINFMKTRDLGVLEIRSGTFSGLLNHSMTLGPVSAIATIFMLWNCLSQRKPLIKILYAIVALLSFLSCLLSASRGAVIACVLGVICLLWMLYRSNLSNLWKYIIGAVVIVLFISLNFPNYTQMLVEKQYRNVERGGSMFASREEKWENRIEEFKSSPLLGIGFASISLDSSDAIDYDIRRYTNDAFSQSGVVEPGSSYLAVLSMTGIIGFIFLWTSVFKKVFAIYKDKQSFCILCLSILACMLVYFFSEGVILASGNYFCFFFWLLIGVIGGIVKNKRYAK